MRITCRGMRDCGDMRDMRDGPPPRNRAVGSAVFLDRPPIHEGRKTGTANYQLAEKGMLIFDLTCCLSII